MKLSDIKNTEPRRHHGDISSLKASIKQLGLLEPLGITKDKELVFGRRRYQALRELGIEEVEAIIVNPANQYERFIMALHENTKRKNLTDGEEAQCEAEQKKLYEEQFPATKRGGDRKSNPQVADLKVASYTEVKSKLEGVSRDTIERRLKIGAAIEKYPELASKRSGQAILAEYKRREVKPVELPTGQYRTIVIDPPWQVDKIVREVSPNQFEYDYPTMTIEEIKALPVASKAMDDCHLYLWTTQKFLPKAFEVLEDWGFKYIFTMVWHKTGGFQPFNLPQYNCEFILFGRKGNLDFMDTKNFFTCFNGERREHSRKPVEFDNLVRRVSPEPRIDYFGREPKEGFDVYGNELSKFK